MLDGQQLGAYALQRVLGQGGMSRVYLAHDIRLHRDVAVKVLEAHLASHPGFRERFVREARVAAALDHPHIVPIFDVGEQPFLYLVMPFLSGGSVQQLLPRAPLPPSEAVSYCSQVADALGFAHRSGVIHRDVKPANMLIHADGRVLLSDFGLAKILANAPTAPRHHPDAGTPEYMAPEQVRGHSTTRSDLYALGIVLYLLLTGSLPFTGPTEDSVMAAQLSAAPVPPSIINPQIPPALEAVILRALAKHPDERYQTAEEMSEALLAALVVSDAHGYNTRASVPSGEHHALPPGSDSRGTLLGK
jgi:serine/threonine protein kinase